MTLTRSAAPPDAARLAGPAAVAVAGVTAALAFLWRVLADPHAALPLFDLTSYQVAGQRVLHGAPLYDSPLIGHVRGVFEFVYPPFAALLFAPLAPLHGAALLWVAGVGGVLLLAAVVGVGLVRPGDGAAALRPGWAVLGWTGLLLWCEPVFETVTFGQINLLVAALVLVDALRPDTARSKGALIGIAVGIKLTPLFFVPYLLLTRRFRAAAMAGAGFLGTVLLGALLLPRDSLKFWTGAFADPARVGVPGHPGNQTLRGLIARGLGDGPGERVLWLVLAGLLAVAGLWLAARLSDRGAEPAAVTVCGMVSTAVSPFSWVHHWVWFVPLLVLLLARARRLRTPSAWGALAVAAAVGSHWYFTVFGLLPGPLDAPAGDLPKVLYQHGYVLLTVALLVAVGWTSRTSPGGSGPGLRLRWWA